MKRFLKWFTLNGIFASIFIVGIYMPLPGLAYIGTASVILLALLTILAMLIFAAWDIITDDVGEEVHKNLNKTINQFIDRPTWHKILEPTFDWAMFVFFVYHAFFFTAFFYFVHMVAGWLMFAIVEGINEKKSMVYKGKNFDIDKDFNVVEH